VNRLLHELLAALVIVAAMAASALAVATVAVLVGAASWPWYVWVPLAPLLYLAWLVAYLLLSAATCGLVGRRHPKPRYLLARQGVAHNRDELLGMATVVMCYRRFALLQSLPLVSVLWWVRHLDTLVMRSYSPSTHLGRNVICWGRLYDPDLTEIGDGVVLGGSSAVAAHTMAIRGDGALVYASAPVRIGHRATIGGEARVSLGCVIGEDAIIEAGAVLEPFTRIPAGEVWGGNPARFRRRRDDVPSVRSEEPAAVPARRTSPDLAAEDAPALERARGLVIGALRLSPEEAAGELSADTCPLWDSLGQVAIAAAIFDHSGVTVDGPEIFRLRTLNDLAAWLEGDLVATPSASRQLPHEEPSLPDDPELLPLLDAQEATRALGASPHTRREPDDPLHLHIVASFTAQPIEPTLELWTQAFGFGVECRFANYGQVVQALLDGSTNGADVTLVLTRPDDLPTDSAEAEVVLDEILDAVEQAASGRPPGGRLVVGTLPPVVSSFAGVEAVHAEGLRAHWRTRLEATAGVELFEFARVVERVGIEAARSSRSEVYTRGGYSQRLHQELAIALVRHLRAANGTTAKVVALDCDNTLWGGVIGEVGLDGLQLGPDGVGRSFQLFQRQLLRLKERGLLLTVVSRNEDDDVRDVFARHPGMVLRAEDIAAWRVNWRHKSENLSELADELNLGLDSFVFLDDDPVARMEVKSRTPAVHVVPLPEDPAGYCETLERLWLFDGTVTTTVDATRTQKAREERRRRGERDSAVSLDEFLRRLELEVELRAAGEGDLARVAQLTQRTNQFNLSLRRRSVEDAKELAEESVVLVLEARDRFGDYGQIGVAVIRPWTTPETWELETFLMSCRALGRGIEDAFLHGVAAGAAERGGTSLVARYRPGPRNGQMQEFLARAGFIEVEPNLWRLSIEPIPPLPSHVRFDDSGARVHHTAHEQQVKGPWHDITLPETG
jgi:FkbH-like protein